MPKSHMKRIAAPRTWPIMRKAEVFSARPKPGKTFELSLPLVTVFRDVLAICKSSKEAQALLLTGTVKVDGAIRKSLRYPVGLFDVIEFTNDKKAYRITLNNRGHLDAVEIDLKQKDMRLLRVARKSTISGGKVQLSFLNGRTLLVEKGKYGIGDSVLLNDKSEVTKHIELKPGVKVLFIGGRHSGSVGTLEAIDGTKITVNLKGTSTETLRRYAFVVGEKDAEITIQ